MKRFTISFLLSCCALSGYGQWNSDSVRNTLVCNATNQQQVPRICSDGNNGCFIVWQDSRHNGYGQVYIQKFDANGVAQWTANGIRICSTGFVQRGPIVASDGNGGAYVVWQDDRNPTTKPDLYAQHFTSNGTPTYGATGKGIARVTDATTNDVTMQKNWVILPDGRGNAYVAWEDSRNAITPESNRPDIYMTRLWPGGVRAPDDGVSVHNAPARQTEPQLILDTLNRCFMVFTTNYPQAPYGIAATQIDTSLNVLWGTNNNPNIIYRNSSFDLNSTRPRVLKYAGMYYLAWEEKQGSAAAGWDILAQKLSNNGTPVWFLPAAMTPSLSGDQVKAIPNTDYAGGMQVVFEDYQGNRNISSSRILANGAAYKPATPNHIYSVCNLGQDQRNPMGIPTEKGMLVFWEDGRKSTGDTMGIYAQVIDTMPSRFYPVANSRWGFPVSTDSTARHSHKDQMDIAPRTNGAIVVWRDGRNYSSSNYDIYMQLVFKNSTLPIELADFRLTRQFSSAVRIDWQTAMEKDNAGFEIERRQLTEGGNEFEVIASYKNIASLLGANNSSSLRSYSYLDVPQAPGKYEYRLVDYSLDGERSVHTPKQIEIGAGSASNDWVILAASPNPFKSRTSVSFIAPRTAIVDMEVIDQLGRIVASPLKNSLLSAGAHTVAINAAELGVSGTYYYSIVARDAETGNIIYAGKPSVINLTR